MVKSKAEKKRQKRLKKKKQIKTSKIQQSTRENGLFHLEEAGYFYNTGNLDLAIKHINRAAKALPHEEAVFQLMGYIAFHSENIPLELDAMNGMERIGKITDEMRIDRVIKLVNIERYTECIKHADWVLENLTQLKIKNKRRTKAKILDIKEYSLFMTDKDKDEDKDNFLNTTPSSGTIPLEPPATLNKGKQLAEESPSPAPIVPQPPKIPCVPIVYKIEETPFFTALSDPEPASPESYELALLSHEIRFTESFETLICLSSLTQVKSFWYQEETAKKVLKQFRGRAMLSDEVGLGKTIEALIILMEYIKRGMVKTGLILTPTPLVSQWKEEIKSKFNMDIPSTDDPGFKSGSTTFWNIPFVIASINQAKSTKNFDFITAREYDMIIVDEAHHLKNRTTQNWKLVNSLKKRFILLLTATPVENNLMELYNLITLLKPGQLETATSFREKFMKRGDPTDPRNRALLKELLGQVMIRNTRALAGINIPPRFAQTIRIEPTKAETAFYERLEALILSLIILKKRFRSFSPTKLI